MTLSTQLSVLEGAGLIRLAAIEPEVAYLFRHGLIQDAAHATRVRGQRRQLHLATAEVLDSAYPAPARQIVPSIAAHSPVPALSQSFLEKAGAQAVLKAGA